MWENFSIVLCYSNGRLCGLLPSLTQHSKTIYCVRRAMEIRDMFMGGMATAGDRHA